MYMNLIAEILLAVLAVFGFYALLRIFVVSHLLPTQTGVTVEIRKGTEPEDVPLLLDRVRDGIFLCSFGRIVALVDAELSEDEALLEALRREGAECYFVQLR